MSWYFLRNTCLLQVVLGNAAISSERFHGNTCRCSWKSRCFSMNVEIHIKILAVLRVWGYGFCAPRKVTVSQYTLAVRYRITTWSLSGWKWHCVLVHTGGFRVKWAWRWKGYPWCCTSIRYYWNRLNSTVSNQQSNSYRLHINCAMYIYWARTLF